MAFTIRFPQTFAVENTIKTVNRLKAIVAKDDRFCFQVEGPQLSFKGLPKNSKSPRVCLILRRIRLLKKKPYCGQHADVCIANGRKKPNATYLEWEDWIQFNGLINDWLDSDWNLKSAEVWSNPQETKGTFWIRKEGKRRIRYEWDTKYDGYGRRLQTWNNGTPDQFEPLDEDERIAAE